VKAPADALLIDLGGVLVALDWERMFASWSRDSGRPAEEIRRRFRFEDTYARHERGEIEAADYYAFLRKDLGLDLTDDQIAEGWGAIFAGEIPETLEMIREASRRVPTYLFSNTNHAHRSVWAGQFPNALAPFRKVFTSCELGLRKPERAAFEHIAREIGVPVQRILFLDDTPENVDGARAAGLQAALVRSPQDVRNALRPWLDAT
jgi:putative hydrolase of the HAD superfamily